MKIAQILLVTVAFAQQLLLVEAQAGSPQVQLCLVLKGAQVETALGSGTKASATCFEVDENEDISKYGTKVGNLETDSSGCLAFETDVGIDMGPIYCALEDLVDDSGIVLMPTVTDAIVPVQDGAFFSFEGEVIVRPDRFLRGDPGSTNGCGASFFPDFVVELVATQLPGFDPSCNVHDLCWENCAETQDSCDEEFLANLQGNCALVGFSKAMDRNECNTKALYMFKLVNSCSGRLVYANAIQKSDCAGGPNCFDFLQDSWKCAFESVVEKLTTTTDRTAVTPCDYLPVDQVDGNYRFYAPPHALEILAKYYLGLLLTAKCIAELLPFPIEAPFDIEPPDADVTLPKFPNIDASILLNEAEPVRSYNPFLDFIPQQACCKLREVAEPARNDFCEKMALAKSLQGEHPQEPSAFDSLLDLSCEASSPVYPPGFYMHCRDGELTCDKCATSDPCTTCTRAFESCSSDEECCQYSTNNNMLFLCDRADYKCRPQPILPVGRSVMCMAWNEGSFETFAFAFKNGFLPFDFESMKFPGSGKGSAGLCNHWDGFKLKETPTLVVTVKPIGLGFSTNGGLSYGTNSFTQNTGFGANVPKVWDGFLPVALPERPGIEFWTSFRLQVQPTPTWHAGKSSCMVNTETPLTPPSFLEKALSLRMDFELYVDGGGGSLETSDQPCIIVTMPAAVIKMLVFEFVIGRGIGGYCRNKVPNRCSPSGFFLNIESTFEPYNRATSSVFGFLFAGFEEASIGDEDDPLVSVDGENEGVEINGAQSYGVFLDDTTGDIRSVVFRLETPSLTVFGFSVIAEAVVHFQWFKGSEFERRRWTLLRKNGQANCESTAATCTSWKPYIGYMDSSWEICESLLFELDPYNQVMMVASDNEGSGDFPKKLDLEDEQDKWFLNPKYDLADQPSDEVLVVYLALNDWNTVIVQMKSASLTVIGIVEASDVYIAIDAEYTVLFFADIKAAGAIQNKVPNSDDWQISFQFEVDVGPNNFAIKARSPPFQWNELDRRRMLNEAASEEDQRRLLERRLGTPSILGSWDLKISFSVDVLGSLVQALEETWNLVKDVGKAIANVAKRALEEVLDFFQNPLQTLNGFFSGMRNKIEDFVNNFDGLTDLAKLGDIKNTFESAASGVSNLFKNGLSFKDLKALAQAAGEGLDELFGNVDETVDCFISNIDDGCTTCEEETESFLTYPSSGFPGDQFGCPVYRKKQRNCGCLKTCTKRVPCGVRTCHRRAFCGWKNCGWKGCKKRYCNVPYPCGTIYCNAPTPCFQCEGWKYFSYEQYKPCRDELVQQMIKIEELVGEADAKRVVIEDNNNQNVKGLKHWIEHPETLPSSVVVGISPTQISTIGGGNFGTVGLTGEARGLPVLRPDDTVPSLDDFELAGLPGLDFFKEGMSMDDVAAALEGPLASAAREKVLKDTKLTGTKFMDFLAEFDPPTLSTTHPTTFVWNECSDGVDDSGLGISEAWEFGSSAIIMKMQKFVLQVYEPIVAVSESLTDKSYTYQWTTISEEYGCEGFVATLELYIVDATGRHSNGLMYHITIPYGHIGYLESGVSIGIVTSSSALYEIQLAGSYWQCADPYLESRSIAFVSDGAEITVSDEIRITCPPDIVLPCGDISPEIAGKPTVVGNCFGYDLSYSDAFENVDSSLHCPIMATRTWVATGSRRASSCDQTILQVSLGTTTHDFSSFNKNENSYGQQGFHAYFLSGQSIFFGTGPSSMEYNVFFFGSPEEREQVEVRIPYPFVTVGEYPVRVYSEIEVLREPRGFQYQPSNEISRSQEGVLEEEWKASNSFGDYAPIYVDVEVPSSGHVHIAISVAYGNVKRNFSGNGFFPPGEPLSSGDGGEWHTFEAVATNESQSFGRSVLQNINIMKHVPSDESPGIGGVRGAPFSLHDEVLLLDSQGNQVSAVESGDFQDDFYFIPFAHSGEPAIYFVAVNASFPGDYSVETSKAIVLDEASKVYIVNFGYGTDPEPEVSGVGGFRFEPFTQEPGEARLLDAFGNILGSSEFDNDYYFIPYEHSGESATYVVEMDCWSLIAVQCSKQFSMNGTMPYYEVNFEFDPVETTSEQPATTTVESSITTSTLEPAVSTTTTTVEFSTVETTPEPPPAATTTTLEPPASSTTTTTDPNDGSTNVSPKAFDDPHFVTWNNTFFDFMGACDLKLLTAPNFAPGVTLDINIRTTIRYAYSYIESAVLLIGDSTLEVTSYGEYFVDGISHADMPAIMSGFTVDHFHPSEKVHIFEIQLEEGEKIIVKAFKDMVGVKLDHADAKRFHGSVGMLGNYDKKGLMMGRDGESVFHDINAFATEWQIKETEPMLFQSQREPQSPEKCRLPAISAAKKISRHLVSVDAAKRACASWPVETFSACVHDVLATNDPQLAEGGAF